ncbi:unnamed protein product [Porites lobata]|uniref:DDE Tnp4 domain-containing protein n=1 Tax=Porites lobata TaxID=104759 RepID=A0ABN8Q080_9CNID|nr:unnamed protein product [Porites lobata]
MYRNRNLEALWKKHFRVTRDTFDYICQLIEGDLQKEGTRLRKAVPVYKRVAVVLWRLGSGNSYRTTGITFGLGKSTVIKICNEFTRAIIRRKDDYFNRKQNYSINLQGTVDGTGMFIDVSTGWPGSMHDARVLRLSSLYSKATDGEILSQPEKSSEGIAVRPLLLGDSAYPLLSWLIGHYPRSATLT